MKAQALDAHQVDARLDLNAAEQGIYADLQVAAEDIQARLGRRRSRASVDELAAEGFPPFVADVAASSRGEHRWSHGETAGRPSYLGVSGKPGWPARSSCCSAAEVWLKPAAAAAGGRDADARPTPAGARWSAASTPA